MGAFLFGTPDWIRTSGLQSRSLTRYPTALRALLLSILYYTFKKKQPFFTDKKGASLLFKVFYQSGKCRFKFYSIPMVWVVLRVLDALNGIVRGDLSRLKGCLAVEIGAYKGRGINIAGAVAVLRELSVLIIGVDAVFINYHSGLSLGVADTGQDHGLGAGCNHFFQKPVNISAIIDFLIRGIREETGLGHSG